MTTTLSTHKLSKHFGGVHAVDHVDVHFAPGQITALIGPNGSGKTTLINILTGVYPISSGTLTVHGDVAEQVTPGLLYTHGITRTFQSVRLVGQISVLDNVLLAVTPRSWWRALFSIPTREQQHEAKQILERVGLWDKRHKHAEQLSYGQRKLLEIARALGTKSTIYFFDEPYAGLFTSMRDSVSGIMHELASSGATVILVEHDMSLIRTLADHVYVLDTGAVLAEGTPHEVLINPKVVEAYLGK
jgi:ABC-type branched-subunit amino acid transport system ATPase component